MKVVAGWRVLVLLMLLLPVSCATPGGVGRREGAPRVVRVEALPEGRARLRFEPELPDPAWATWRREEAREVLAAFHSVFPKQRKPGLRLVRTSAGQGAAEEGASEEWESRLREEYLSRFGPGLVPLPRSMEESRVFLALRLSPRYMGAGVSEAARELFSSPVFLSSVALSVLVYFAAWLAPEPVFTKAFVAALTLRLSLLVGAWELTRVGQACVRLYQEAEAARTVEELEAAAEHFGKAMGGTGLRVLVWVASMGVGKALPEVPEGGLGALLKAPRFALPEGLELSEVTSVQMVADGSIVVAGVAAGTALGSACADGSEKKEGYQWHHLATNKNGSSSLQGGPWTPLFEKLFARAGMRLDDAENLVYMQGHQGPHPEEYHSTVYRRIEEALGECQTPAECRDSLRDVLRRLAREVCTPGTKLHQLMTQK